MIEVTRTQDGDPLGFDVAVSVTGGSGRHQVTMDQATADRLAGGHTPEACIEAAFRFLLDREPPSAIMSRFDVTVIARYFPEFEDRLPDYLKDV